MHIPCFPSELYDYILMCVYIDQAYFKEDKIILHTLVCNLVIFLTYIMHLHLGCTPKWNALLKTKAVYSLCI